MFGALLRLLGGGPRGPDPREEARLEAARLLREAEQEAKSRLLQAKEDALQARSKMEEDVKSLRHDVQRYEERLTRREETLDRKSSDADRRDERLRTNEEHLGQKEEQIGALIEEQRVTLERLSGMTADEARTSILETIDDEVRADALRRMRHIEALIKDEAEGRARKIIATAIQRVATETTSETTVSAVPIPSDDMKGRIIGREGRNIRALEAATGCDLIIDDTPETVTLSSFDPVRREIGRQALTRLVQDGRIHPTRIEEVVEKARQEVEHTIREAGEAAAVEAECPAIHKDMLHIFGRLRFRTSYGQNQLSHAVETAHIAGMIATEMGARVDVCRQGGLLHDMGKAVDHEVEGTHAIIGADIARRFKLPDPVVNCIEAHHEEVDFSCTEAIVVQMADAISGGRPGARRESLDRYIKRLEALEEIAHSFGGVEQAFAIQAGREIRVVVRPDAVDDLEAMRMARDISRKIEENLQYPGQVRVTVVRETRATEIAR